MKIKNCVLSRAGTSAKIQITDSKFCLPIVTLSTKNNVELAKQLSDEFKRFAYWSEYQTLSTEMNNGAIINQLLDTSFQDIKRLFVFTYDTSD